MLTDKPDSNPPGHGLRIVVLLPCFNETRTIYRVVAEFKRVLPEARVYVYDNNSTDGTAEAARRAGAVVRHEPLQGKGNVIRRMFADIDADVYLMVDGDGTYETEKAPVLIEALVSHQLDMVCGARVAEDQDKAYRTGHVWGNHLLSGVIAWLFGNRFRDVFTGYRVFSRRFVKSFPALSPGFEIETELTVHALELRMPVLELDTRYGHRPEGSVSKLRTWRDGLQILRAILVLLKEVRPLFFFTSIFLILSAISVLLSWPLLGTYLETGEVPRFPTAILSTGLMLLAFINLTSGIILDSVTRGRRELKRMHYLNVPPVRRETN